MIYISEELKKEKKLFEILSDFRIVHKLPKNKICAVKRKNEFLLPYDYGPGVIDKDQYVLRLSLACPASCKYCYIKSLYSNYPPTFFYNISDIRREIENILKQKKTIYINCGENSDSFAFDNISCQSLVIYELALEFSNSFFELRSKIPSHANKRFLEEKSLNNIIISCTLNPDNIIKKYEIGTDSLIKRIEMLEYFKRLGYKIALRIDPVIYEKDFFDTYEKLCEVINNKFDKNDLFDIQIGCLRLTKEQYKSLDKSKPDFLREELILGFDKKWRYFIGIRLKIYKFLMKCLSKFSGKIYLSNENAKVINRIFS